MHTLPLGSVILIVAEGPSPTMVDAVTLYLYSISSYRVLLVNVVFVCSVEYSTPLMSI